MAKIYPKGSLGWIKNIGEKYGIYCEGFAVGNVRKELERIGILKMSAQVDRECKDKICKSLGYVDSKEYRRELYYEKGVHLPAYVNESCSAYLGTVIGERRDARKILPIILGKIIKEMPYGNPGFDFLIDGDIKVDVKSRRLINNRYDFMIRYNNISDYFLCIGYEEDESGNLIPVHMWLFKKDEMIRKQEIGSRYIIDKFYRRDTFGISKIPAILDKFRMYDKIDAFRRINGNKL